MSDFELIAIGVLAALTAYVIALHWTDKPTPKHEWDSGDPGPHYGRDPKGRF